MSEQHNGPGGDPAEGSRQVADRNLKAQSTSGGADEKPTPKTPKDAEGDTGGGRHPPVKSETGA